MLGLAIIIAIESLILAVLLFGDIGFDHPGRFGLDFDGAIILIVLYLGLLLGGVTYAVRHKRWRMTALQLVIPLIVFFVVGIAPRMRESLNAADYQHLVGKSRTEVREALGGRPSLSSGFMSDDQGERGFETYDAMSIYYSKEGRVLSVESP